MKPEDISPEMYIDIQENVVILPYIYDLDTNTINKKGLLQVANILNS